LLRLAGAAGLLGVQAAAERAPVDLRHPQLDQPAQALVERAAVEVLAEGAQRAQGVGRERAVVGAGVEFDG